MTIEVAALPEFSLWFDGLSLRERLLIKKRLLVIEQDEHFGDCKYLSDGLFELRWKNGTRIYFAKISKDKILLLFGGIKNGQKKDIKKARLLLERLS